MWFISKNQIKASKKRVVVFVYSFRLLLAAFSIVTTKLYIGYLHGSDDVIGLAPLVAWQEMILGFSLISASIPCLRNFLWAFMSTGLMTIYATHEPTGITHSGSHQLASQRSPESSAIHSEARNQNQHSRIMSSRLRPEWLEYQVDVQSQQPQGRRDAGQSTSSIGTSTSITGTGELIIHHTTGFEIEHSRRPS